MGRECNSCVGTAAVRSLVDVCGEILSRNKSVRLLHFFVTIHTLPFTHLDSKAHEPKCINNTREGRHER